MLSCTCNGGDYDWWYYGIPENFETFDGARRKRCISCNELINIGSDCVRFDCYCSPRSFVEENIYGDEVPIANRFMCEKCGEIFLNLSALGYCLEIGHNVKEDLEDYWELTGFEPREVDSTHQ